MTDRFALPRLALALLISTSAHALLFMPLVPGLGSPAIEGAATTRGGSLAVRLAAPAHAVQAPRPPAALAPLERASSVAATAGSTEIYFSGSEVDRRALPLNEVALAYPEAALDQGLSGAVRLRLSIDRYGILRGVVVVSAQPAGVFETAAVDAVSGLKFQPALRNGLPVASVKTIEVPFDPDCQSRCLGGSVAAR